MAYEDGVAPKSETEGSSTRSRGRRQEQRASEFLQERGLELLAQNVEVAGGELDLVFVDPHESSRTIVFVEVRSRKDDLRGHPIETISRAKRRHLIRAATGWLVGHALWEQVAVRFDVITIVAERVEWWRDAFDAGS